MKRGKIGVATFSTLLFLLLLIPQTSFSQNELNPLKIEKLSINIFFFENNPAQIIFYGVYKNTANVHVVPGYGIINISCKETGFTLSPFIKGSSLTVKKVSAENPETKQEKEAIVLRSKGNVAVRYSLWDPIEPNGEYPFQVTLMVRGIVAEGLIFNELNFEIGPFSSEIKNGEIILHLPRGYHFTYSSKQLVHGGTLKITNFEPGERIKVNCEFSKFPFPLLPLQGYILFWCTILLTGITLLIYRKILKKL